MIGGSQPDRIVGTATTTLSLFLLLLVFFVVLSTTVEWRPQKAVPVLRSVEAEFGALGSDGDEDDLGRGPAWETARASLQAVGELLRREFPVAKVNSEGNGALWVIDLPAGELFEAGSVEVRATRVGLLHRIAVVLASPPEGIGFRSSAVLALAGPVVPGPSSVARVSALGAALIAGGAPARSVSVGLDRGQAGMIRFYFGIEMLPGGKL